MAPEPGLPVMQTGKVCELVPLSPRERERLPLCSGQGKHYCEGVCIGRSGAN